MRAGGHVQHKTSQVAEQQVLTWVKLHGENKSILGRISDGSLQRCASEMIELFPCKAHKRLLLRAGGASGGVQPLRSATGRGFSNVQQCDWSDYLLVAGSAGQSCWSLLGVWIACSSVKQDQPAASVWAHDVTGVRFQGRVLEAERRTLCRWEAMLWVWPSAGEILLHALPAVKLCGG